MGLNNHSDGTFAQSPNREACGDLPFQEGRVDFGFIFGLRCASWVYLNFATAAKVE